MKEAPKFMAALQSAGMSKTGLAAALGLKAGTVYRWVDATVPQYVWAYLGVVTK